MLPIPGHLASYAAIPQQKGDILSFQLHCPCGCEAFTIPERCYTDREQQQIRQYEQAMPDVGWHTVHGRTGPDGKPVHYIRILGIFKKYIIFPPTPPFMKVSVFKAACTNCGREAVLFDSRLHGLPDDTEEAAALAAYTPHFRQKSRKAYRLEVMLEVAPDTPAGSFSWICIRGTDEQGRRKTLFGAETD